MAKADLGTKRVCPNCGTRYYDLNKTPIICPKCGTPFEVAAKPQAVAKPAEPEELEAAKEETEEAGPEVISLEDADAEAGAGNDEADGEDDGVDDDEDDDTFLEEDEDEDDDVTDIIGDVEDDDD